MGSGRQGRATSTATHVASVVTSHVDHITSNGVDVGNAINHDVIAINHVDVAINDDVNHSMINDVDAMMMVNDHSTAWHGMGRQQGRAAHSTYAMASDGCDVITRSHDSTIIARTIGHGAYGARVGQGRAGLGMCRVDHKRTLVIS
jgi:hypothetical protein